MFIELTSILFYVKNLILLSYLSLAYLKNIKDHSVSIRDRLKIFCQINSL